jgi:uncharacterized membrane protein
MDWLLTLCVIAASVLAARAFFRIRALTATILALKASVEVLDQRLSRLEDLPATVPEAPLPEETVGFLNPVMPLFGAPVEGWFLLDTLFLAYAIPAMLYAVLGFYRLGPRALWQAALVLAAGFFFLWVTLEVRHFFHGDRLNQGLTGEAEWYAYSAAWLAFAAAGLGAALKWRSLWLRRASLLGLGLVVGKVFLSDMADLSGALRALSFIGLGLVLVGIGYAYRDQRWPRLVSVGRYCCATSGDDVRTVKLLPPPVRFASQLASHWTCT